MADRARRSFGSFPLWQEREWLAWPLAVAAVAACSSRSSKPAAATAAGSDATPEVTVLRSAVVPPRCSPRGPAPVPPSGATLAKIDLAPRVAACRTPSPADVCACLAKDLSVLGAGFARGPGSCELAKASSNSVHVATVFGSEGSDRLVPAISTVLIVRDASGWAAHGATEAVADIDLTETPEMSAGVEVAAVSEAVYGAARFAWVQTVVTEADVAADERYIDETTTLMVCELGEPVRCGQVDLAAWQYVVVRTDDDEDEDGATGGGCWSAEGVSLQAEQRDASGLTVSGAAGSDGAGPRLVPFKRE